MVPVAFVAIDAVWLGWMARGDVLLVGDPVPGRRALGAAVLPGRPW
jgi:hypothetical protein